MNEVAELWIAWDNIISEYAEKPLPSFPSWENTSETKDDIIKRCREVAQIHFVLENKEKIEHMLFFLTTMFGFSISELKASISFYDALFALSESEAEWKVNYFLRLFGSHENFLKAMRTGTPFYPLEEREKEFRGIMSYKRLEVFEEKLESFSSELELPMECATSIFVSQSWYMYCSAKALKSQLEERCEFFSVPKGKIGQILIRYPWFLACTKGVLEHTEQTLRYSFLLSEKEAKMVILKYPNVLINPHKTLLNTIAPERSADIPTIIVQKPWLYTLYKVVRYCCDDYGYGSYETVLKFLQYIEALFGKIEQVYFKQMAPLANGGERRKKTIPYTVLLIERKDSRGSYYFVSLGSGYGTAHSSSRSRMMKMLFNEVFFEEFIVETPPKETDAYSKMLLDVFNMCSTGNNSYDIFELQDGTAVVVKEPEGALRNTHCICDGVSCGFKTIQILPLEQAREEKKEWIEKIEQELDELDEFGDECTEDFFEDMYVDDDEID